MICATFPICKLTSSTVEGIKGNPFPCAIYLRQSKMDQNCLLYICLAHRFLFAGKMNGATGLEALDCFDIQVA